MALATAVATSGCAALPISAGYTGEASQFGDDLPASAEALAPGDATYTDVLDALGPPAVVTALPEGFAFLYESGRLGSRSFGASIYALRAGYAWSDGEFAAAAYVFDNTGRLTGRAVERSGDEIGRGFSVGTERAAAADQLIYLLPAGQSAWGKQMLRRVPSTLNQASNPASGQSGLERRGTSATVGQRSLESGYSSAVGLLELLRTQTGN